MGNIYKNQFYISNLKYYKNYKHSKYKQQDSLHSFKERNILIFIKWATNVRFVSPQSTNSITTKNNNSTLKHQSTKSNNQNPQPINYQKYSSFSSFLQNRTQVNQFPSPPSHIQQKIQKLSQYNKYLLSLSEEQRDKQQKSRKIFKCKSPFNIFYMNLESREENYPIGKCIIYKLKDNGEFGGYFEGVLKENLVMVLEKTLIIFSNGSYFQGIGDKEGRYVNENSGLKYEGGWQNQMPLCQGRQKNNKGIYDGSYQKGQKFGKGKFVWNDGSFYEGKFQKGYFSGQGKLIDTNQKYQYVGQFKNGQKHGKGNQKTRKQNYNGQFMYGARCGKGQLKVYQNQNSQKAVKIYKGDFYANMPQGKGELVIMENGREKQKISGFWTRGKITAVNSIL